MGRQEAMVCKVSLCVICNSIISISVSEQLRNLTFVGLEPAVSFSRNTGMAKDPNAGVALRHRLHFC
jgi:hypothetical protein